MKLLGTFPILAYAVVILSIVGVSVATESATLLLVCGVLAAMSWYITEGPRGRSLPNWTANVLVIAVLLSSLVDLAQHEDDLMGVLARFIVWLMLIKLYQHKRPRDYAQLLGLSLLVMLIGAMRSADLMFAAVLLIYGILGLYVLLLFQLYAANEHTRAGRLQAIPPGYRQLPSLQPIFGRRTALHLRALTATVTVTGLVASTVLFVLFPREHGAGSIWGSRWQGPPRTGFAAEVDLVGGTRITDSRRIALKLALSGDQSGLTHPPRLRGAALDLYKGKGQWRSSARAHQEPANTTPPELTWLGQLDRDPQPPEIGATLTMEFDVLSRQSMLFSVYAPVAVGTKTPQRINYDPVTQTLEDLGRRRLTWYRIKADPAPSDATLQALVGRLEPGGGGAIVRQFAGFDPGVTAFAREALAAAGLAQDPPADEAERWAWHAAAAEALAARLRTAPDFRYTLDLSDVDLPPLAGPDEDPRDPIAHFLLETRTGHCEYFASGLAALCNCLGIPARLVTGYVAVELDAAAASYIIRDANAHAWVEAQVSPWRWQTFDPTPPDRLMPPGDSAAPSLADRWRWLLDRFEARWMDGFVAFDGDSQRRLMDALGADWMTKLNRGLDATGEWLWAVNRAFNLGPAGYIWMGIVALAVVIAAIALATRTKRAARLRATMHLAHARGGAYHRMLRQLGFYLDMLEALEHGGRAKPAWQPPLHFARALSVQHPTGASLVRRLTDLYYAARFGGRPLSREELHRAEDLVRELRGALLGADGRGRGTPAQDA